MPDNRGPATTTPRDCGVFKAGAAGSASTPRHAQSRSSVVASGGRFRGRNARADTCPTAGAGSAHRDDPAASVPDARSAGAAGKGFENPKLN